MSFWFKTAIRTVLDSATIKKNLITILSSKIHAKAKAPFDLKLLIELHKHVISQRKKSLEHFINYSEAGRCQTRVMDFCGIFVRIKRIRGRRSRATARRMSAESRKKSRKDTFETEETRHREFSD